MTSTIPQIVNTSFGGANSNVNAAPGSIVEAQKIYTIANIIAACVNTTGTTTAATAEGDGATTVTDPNNHTTTTLNCNVRL